MMDDHTQLVTPSESHFDDVKPVDQLVIRTPDGEDRHFRLFPRMRTEQLLKRVADEGITEFATAWLHTDSQHSEEHESLVRKAWPSKGLTRQPDTEPGVQKMRGRITFTVDGQYFRAIAKIAFHYYLSRSKYGTLGSEPEFADIRKFIIEGGNVSDFFPDGLMRFKLPFGGRQDGTASKKGTF